MSRKPYPVRIARAALGIRAQSLRTLARKAWWARRWIAAIEALRLGPRLGRGRQYAISGQVTDLRFKGPHVMASVAGSRPQPYQVTLDFTAPPPDGLERLSARLKARPTLLARLLVDDLPLEVETLFAAEGCPLFPVAGSHPPYDVKMACNCPDWAKPCKHIAAVLFLLGEEVTRRPQTLLALRGLDPDYIFPPDDVSSPCEPSIPFVPSSSSAGSTVLLRRLGPIPFWRGLNRCEEALEKMVVRQRPVALAAACGDSIDLRGSSGYAGQNIRRG